MATIFISDLHLSRERPQITRLFIDFLNNQARNCQALYILGDLFEVWLGDDMVLPEYQEAIHALKQLALNDVPIFIMYGNRDFLMREEFEVMSGARLLYEPHIITLHDQPTLLLHGDTLCTDDLEYQKLRKMVRDPTWQAEVLARTPEQRLALAEQLRETSKQETAQKDMSIMDVNQDSVISTMQKNNVRRLIHGHTHRPGIHHFVLDNRPAERIVLGDWYTAGSYLLCDDHRCELRELTS